MACHSLWVSMSQVHIIGAGLAGLSAAVELSKAGKKVALYESAKQAGGRCRSYFDPELNCRVDNGNHLIVSGNRSVMAYIDAIQSHNSFDKGNPIFPFIDLEKNKKWNVQPNLSLAFTYFFDFLRLRRASPETTARESLDVSKGNYRSFWEPLIVAALNTEPAKASARLTSDVLRQTFAKGKRALLPFFPKQGLSESLVDPALQYVQEKGGSVSFSSRLRSLTIKNDRIDQLHFSDRSIDIAEGDQIILAVPSWVAAELLKDIQTPQEYRSIINIHYAGEVDFESPFLGIVGGLAEWVFFKPGHISVTISAADPHIERNPEDLAKTCWSELATIIGKKPLPPYRVIKEKRATFAATPEQLRLRPATRTRYANLYLAGDWTDTGWPATIEGAVKSGKIAAQRVLSGWC